MPDQENLLRNPNFEEGYREFEGKSELRVAIDWDPWWHFQSARPEYKIAIPNVDPRRVYNGNGAQQWFNNFDKHTAGIRQVVGGVPFGSAMHFEAQVQCFSSNEDDFSHSRGRYRMRIGVDPYGGTDPESPDIVWSGNGHAIQPYDQYELLSVEVVSRSDRCTVFVWGQAEWSLKHNNAYVDACRLCAVDQEPEPGPEPPPDGWTEGEIRDIARGVLIEEVEGWLGAIRAR